MDAEVRLRAKLALTGVAHPCPAVPPTSLHAPRNLPPGAEREHEPDDEWSPADTAVASPQDPEEERVDAGDDGTCAALHVVHDASGRVAPVRAKGAVGRFAGMLALVLVLCELVGVLELAPAHAAALMFLLLVAARGLVRRPHTLAPPALEAVHVLHVRLHFVQRIVGRGDRDVAGGAVPVLVVVELVLEQLALRGPRQVALVAAEAEVVRGRHVSPALGVGVECEGTGVALQSGKGVVGLRAVSVARA